MTRRFLQQWQFDVKYPFYEYDDCDFDRMNQSDSGWALFIGIGAGLICATFIIRSIYAQRK
jgi:hypothetical protein